jgi:hypothetical protein
MQDIPSAPVSLTRTQWRFILIGRPATPFRRGVSPCPQDEGDDGGQCPDRRTGADRRAEGREGMMKGMGSSSIDCEGRGMPEKSKNRPFPSTFVTLGSP